LIAKVDRKVDRKPCLQSLIDSFAASRRCSTIETPGGRHWRLPAIVDISSKGGL